MGVFTTSYLLLWALVIFLLALAIGLLDEIKKTPATSTIPARPETVRIGDLAPGFTATNLRNGELVDSVADAPAHEYALIFVKAGCRNCKTLMGAIARTQYDYVLVCRGDHTLSEAFASTINAHVPILEDDGHISAQYGIERSPTVVIIADRRVRGYGQPTTADAFKQLWQYSLSPERQPARDDMVHASL
ncbi:MAG TPA: hypothetical protein VL173_05745 [Vicinamibacterales bacterium]|jgi:hypothetical protein|nr:hypothetical protein [Vicinamibacterales bacterium]